MTSRVLLFVAVILLAGSSEASAGKVYKVISKDGDKTIAYEVQFGGGRKFEQHTAFDPETKKFVYLQWKRGGEQPAPAMKVWDHRTGETLQLYRFPNAKN